MQNGKNKYDIKCSSLLPPPTFSSFLYSQKPLYLAHRSKQEGRLRRGNIVLEDTHNLLLSTKAKCRHLKKFLPVKGLCGRCLSA